MRVKGSLSGTDIVPTNAIPIVIGTPFSFHLGLLAFSQGPGSTFAVDSDFQAKMTGIEVRNASNEMVANFVVTADSGTRHNAGGAVVHVLPRLGVPELVVVAVMLTVAGAYKLRARRRA